MSDDKLSSGDMDRDKVAHDIMPDERLIKEARYILDRSTDDVNFDDGGRVGIHAIIFGLKVKSTTDDGMMNMVTDVLLVTCPVHNQNASIFAKIVGATLAELYVSFIPICTFILYDAGMLEVPAVELMDLLAMSGGKIKADPRAKHVIVVSGRTVDGRQIRGYREVIEENGETKGADHSHIAKLDTDLFSDSPDSDFYKTYFENVAENIEIANNAEKMRAERESNEGTTDQPEQ